ncbi:MAG: hypothetical protein CNIPEHKO_01000 [Anaerolineales bacterium]|nr:hypothetical protein [Anaerolineales bacterium]
MDEQSNAPIFLPPAGGSGGRMLAIASLILGVMSLCGWFLPICSVPLCVAGAVLGYLAMNDASQENLATVGMVLSTISILLTCATFAMNHTLEIKRLLQGL